MAIIVAMLDREKRDEKETTTAKMDMDHLHHLAKYYQHLM
jgi:hypothetical protein